MFCWLTCFCRLAAAAAQVPQLQEELRLSLEQCSQSQEVAKGLAAKVKALEEELERLRKQESEHQAELASIKQAEQEKVDGLNRKLGEVDKKCQRLSSEVTKQSTLLTETARRWTEDISRLDRGLAGKFCFPLFLFSSHLSGSSCQLAADSAGSRQLD